MVINSVKAFWTSALATIQRCAGRDTLKCAWFIVHWLCMVLGVWCKGHGVGVGFIVSDGSVSDGTGRRVLGSRVLVKGAQGICCIVYGVGVSACLGAGVCRR